MTRNEDIFVDGNGISKVIDKKTVEENKLNSSNEPNQILSNQVSPKKKQIILMFQTTQLEVLYFLKNKMLI